MGGIPVKLTKHRVKLEGAENPRSKAIFEIDVSLCSRAFLANLIFVSIAILRKLVPDSSRYLWIERADVLVITAKSSMLSHRSG
jgi:hypothetical protein